MQNPFSSMLKTCFYLAERFRGGIYPLNDFFTPWKFPQDQFLQKLSYSVIALGSKTELTMVITALFSYKKESYPLNYLGTPLS